MSQSGQGSAESGPTEASTTRVCIIGTGFAGIAMALGLLRAGRTDFVLLERADEIGGTWRDNVYPGCACDVASHLYSLSRVPEPGWSHRYARQPEIQAYLRRIVDEHGLRERTWFGASVESAVFSEETGTWRVGCTDGRRLEARVLVSGVGALKDPRLPAVRGLETFAGAAMHSARWDPGVDLRGKRVGVVGTGASAVQVVPAIADEAAAVVVIQRSPAWVVRRKDRAFLPLETWANAHVPGLMALRRFLTWLRHELRYPLVFGRVGPVTRIFEGMLRRHILREVADPDLAAALTPAYRPGCKRILISDDWYATLQRPDVELRTGAVAAVRPEGLVLEDGEAVDLDVIVWCTGFTVDQPLSGMRLQGRGGVELEDAWAGRPRAWLGITVPRFPNAFLLLGPNTALGHNSVVIMIEAQVRYVLSALRFLDGQGEGAWVDLEPEHLEAFIAEVDASHAGQVWATGCHSWYLNEAGQNFTVWPGSTLSYIWRTRRFDPERYGVGGLSPRAG